MLLNVVLKYLKRRLRHDLDLARAPDSAVVCCGSE
jgi:hypothetical protein